MENGKKNKIGFFAFGLLSGLSLGVVFGYAIKEGLSHLNFLHSSLNQIDMHQSQIALRLDTIENKLKTSRQPKVEAKALMQVAKRDMGTGNAKVDNKANLILNSDSAGKALTDVSKQGTNDSNVVIMTDQMISFRNIPLVNTDSTKNLAARKSDSLIGALNDGVSQNDISLYRTEFWESPINLKGYKMSAGKLILFGINSITPIKLIQCNGAVYMVAGQDVYKTEFTDDFRPYEKVMDKNLIKKLKE